MFLIDTSVLVTVLRNRPPTAKVAFQSLVQDQPFYLSRPTQTELLGGCKDKREWQLLTAYLEGQDYLEMQNSSWVEAARIYYDLRRCGYTIRSMMDCCIAQLALEHDLILVHCDRDFTAIERVRSLECRYFSVEA